MNQLTCSRKNQVQGETELSFRLIPSLTQSHTKPRTKTVREEVILAKEGISLKDNSVSPCKPTQVYLSVIGKTKKKEKGTRVL